MVKRFANEAWFLLLVATLVLPAMAGSSREFVLELPQGIDTARSVVLVLSDVRLPRNAAVVLRVRVADSADAEVALGSIGVLAESKDAEGTAVHAALRIDVTKTLKRWRKDHPGVNAMRIRVVPYAGKEPLASLEWSAASADLKPGA